ncbi:hypothetical protein [Vibrio nomapromontoriensis]|uniref:hypothetical protein n=1 Tax=Vibrio nomapromontoriensis TaxID=2910246 RepID=UPI003D0FED00
MHDKNLELEQFIKEPNYVSRNRFKLCAVTFVVILYCINIELLFSSNIDQHVSLEITAPFFWILLICHLILVWMMVSFAANLDNNCFLKKIPDNKLVFVCHKGSAEIIDKKLASKKLVPYPVKADSKFQKCLPKRVLEWIDHPTPVTWISYGTPMMTKDIKQGSVTGYETAIVFSVKKSDLSFPKGFSKKLFGRHQMIIEKEINLYGNVHLYRNHAGKWTLVRSIEFPRIINGVLTDTKTTVCIESVIEHTY